MKLTIEGKVSALGDIMALCETAIIDLYAGNLSDFQKDVVLAQRGLELIFESVQEETKERMKKK